MIDDGPDPENPPLLPLPDPFQTHAASMVAGILTIAMLCFYALVIAVGILAALVAFLTQ